MDIRIRNSGMRYCIIHFRTFIYISSDNQLSVLFDPLCTSRIFALASSMYSGAASINGDSILWFLDYPISHLFDVPTYEEIGNDETSLYRSMVLCISLPVFISAYNKRRA